MRTIGKLKKTIANYTKTNEEQPLLDLKIRVVDIKLTKTDGKPRLIKCKGYRSTTNTTIRGLGDLV